MDLAALALLCVPCDTSDLQRFPSLIYVEHVQSAIDARITWIESQQVMYPPWSSRWLDWDEELGKVRRIHYVWAVLHDARTVSLDEDKVERLQRLRCLIGEAGYAAGQMPQPVR